MEEKQLTEVELRVVVRLKTLQDQVNFLKSLLPEWWLESRGLNSDSSSPKS